MDQDLHGQPDSTKSSHEPQRDIQTRVGMQRSRTQQTDVDVSDFDGSGIEGNEADELGKQG